nr:MAG TPA: hypothetical protein [Caudoviricetes sp.]
MPTQIAATPVVRGEAAKAILKEMQRKPSEESRRGAEILARKFENIVKR